MFEHTSGRKRVEDDKQQVTYPKSCFSKVKALQFHSGLSRINSSCLTTRKDCIRRKKSIKSFSKTVIITYTTPAMSKKLVFRFGLGWDQLENFHLRQNMKLCQVRRKNMKLCQITRKRSFRYNESVSVGHTLT